MLHFSKLAAVTLAPVSLTVGVASSQTVLRSADIPALSLWLPSVCK